MRNTLGCLSGLLCVLWFASTVEGTSLTEFGATCDGRHDDTPAFVLATVMLPDDGTLTLPGTCVLDTRDAIQFPRGWILFTQQFLRLEGGTVLLYSPDYLDGLAFDAVQIVNGQRVGTTQPTLRNLTIQFMTPLGRGVRILHGRGAVVDQVHFSGTVGGINVCLTFNGHVDGETWGNVVLDSLFLNCNVGVWFQQSISHSRILASTFLNGVNGLYADGWGVDNGEADNTFLNVTEPIYGVP